MPTMKRDVLTGLTPVNKAVPRWNPSRRVDLGHEPDKSKHEDQFRGVDLGKRDVYFAAIIIRESWVVTRSR